MRKKEAEVCGAMWDSLPVTEKERDEICFQNLNAEVEFWIFEFFLIFNDVQIL